jgi:hypothetical protein
MNGMKFNVTPAKVLVLGFMIITLAVTGLSSMWHGLLVLGVLTAICGVIWLIGRWVDPV